MPSFEPDRSCWINAIEQHQEFDYYVHTYLVCSLHFKPSDLTILGKRKILKKGTVPTIFQNQDQAINIQQGYVESSMEKNNNESNWDFGFFDFENNDEQESEFDLRDEQQLEPNLG